MVIARTENVDRAVARRSWMPRRAPLCEVDAVVEAQAA